MRMIAKQAILFSAVSVNASLRSKYRPLKARANSKPTAVVYLEPNTQELNVTHMFTPIQEGDQLLLLTSHRLRWWKLLHGQMLHSNDSLGNKLHTQAQKERTFLSKYRTVSTHGEETGTKEATTSL